MQHTETAEQAAEFSHSAINLMAQQGIEASPNNFAVWYGYFSGRDPQMVRALDVLLSNKAEFTPERCEEIYQKYIGFERENAELRDTVSRLQGSIGQVLEHLGTAGQEQSAYGAKLAGMSGQLAGANGSSEAVGALVREILNETKTILQTNKALESRLGESTHEIGQLRQHLEEVRREAMTDALTGIANRKYFDVTLRDEAKIAMEDGSNLCLLLADIDHFKRFNDTYGHLVGDEVLKVVSRLLKDGVKGRDTPARYGGEEFAVILPRTALNGATTVANQMCEALATRKLKNRKSGDDYGRVTLSIGVAQYRLGEPLDSLIKRADQGLYRAKGEGRNRVVPETELDELLSEAS